MNRYVKVFCTLIIFAFTQSTYALFCEAIDFHLDDYDNLEPIRAYVISKQVPEATKKRLERRYCANRTRCSLDEINVDEFLRLHSVVEPDVRLFVTQGYKNKLKHTVVDIAEVIFPNLKVGEEYLFFIDVYDESVSLYGYHPCAVIPISEEVNKETYFFNEPPNEILSILENESLDFQR